MTSVVDPAAGMKILDFGDESEEVRMSETSDFEDLLIDGLVVSKMI